MVTQIQGMRRFSPSVQLVHDVIEFANTGMIRGKRISEPHTQAFRERLTKDLDLIAGGFPLPGSAVKRLMASARHVTITPFDFDARNNSLLYKFGYRNWAAIYSYEVLNIYAARLAGADFPGDLRRCQLDDCDKPFFFVSDLRPDPSVGGKPPTKYCSREHMLARHAKTSAERVARHRARQKERVGK